MHRPGNLDVASRCHRAGLDGDTFNRQVHQRLFLREVRRKHIRKCIAVSGVQVRRLALEYDPARVADERIVDLPIGAAVSENVFAGEHGNALGHVADVQVVPEAISVNKAAGQVAGLAQECHLPPVAADRIPARAGERIAAAGPGRVHAHQPRRATGQVADEHIRCIIGVRCDQVAGVTLKRDRRAVGTQQWIATAEFREAGTRRIQRDWDRHVGDQVPNEHVGEVVGVRERYQVGRVAVEGDEPPVGTDREVERPAVARTGAGAADADQTCCAVQSVEGEYVQRVVGVTRCHVGRGAAEDEIASVCAHGHGLDVRVESHRRGSRRVTCQRRGSSGHVAEIELPASGKRIA